MDLRKSWPNIVSSHVLSHWLNLSFARNARGDANIGTKILSPFACNFTKNGALSPLFFKDFVIFLGAAIFWSHSCKNLKCSFYVSWKLIKVQKQRR